MALKAGYKGIKKFIADKLNKMNSGDTFATDAEIAAATQQIYADIGVVGAKNLLDNIATSYERNGITWTVNSDGIVKVNGTATAHESQYVISSQDLSNLLNTYGDLILTGCPSGGGDNTYQIFVSASGVYEYDRGEGLLLSKNKTYSSILIQIRNGYTANNVVFKPMLRLATDPDPTYQPYAQTNRELTVNKADNTVIGTVENGTNPTKSYAVGEHFIRNGKFCTITVPVTTSSTWTLGSNYVEGTIADNLIKKATFSGATSQYGGLEIDSTGEKILLSAISDSSNQLCFFFKDAGKSYLNIRLRADMSIVSNTTVSGTYYYI